MAGVILSPCVDAQPAATISGFEVRSFATIPGAALESVAVGSGGALGHDIYVTSQGTIFRIPRSGGVAVPVLTGGAPALFVETAPGGRLFSVDSFGGNLTELAFGGSSLSVVRKFGVITSSEGLQSVTAGPWAGNLLVTDWGWGGGSTAVYRLDLSTGSSVPVKIQDVVTSGFGPLEVDTSPGSAFGDDLYTVDQSGRIYRLSGTSQSLLAYLGTGSEAIAFPPPGSVFGDYLYAITNRGDVLRIDANGVLTRFATGFSSNLWASSLEFSPEGNQLFVAANGESTLYVIESNADSDGDGLLDSVETNTGKFVDEFDTGTDPDNPDTDGDGLLDGTEVGLAVNGCPDPLNPDSDGDLIPDGDEVTNGTDPCSADTDADGLCDLIDPDPLRPGTSSGALEDAVRILADQIDAFGLALFRGPNANVNSGRRNSMSNRIRNAANSIARGSKSSAIALLTTVLAQVDGQGNDEWMSPSTHRDALAACLVILIQTLT